MSFSSDKNAGDNILASHHNALRDDIFGAHHQDAGGTKLVNADIDNAAAISLDKTSDSATRIALTNAAQTIDGEKTFSTFPITPSATPDANYEVANKKYVDDNSKVLEYVEIAPVSTTVSSSNTWEDWDLSGSIPSGALYVEIMIRVQVGNAEAGVRENGSALSRFFTSQEPQVYFHYTSILDVNRIVEIYHSETNSEFYALGYWQLTSV